MHQTSNRRYGALVAAAAALAMAVTVVLAVAPAGADTRRATARLIDAGGAPAGAITFTQVRGQIMSVNAHVDNLVGFHGFHIHAGTACRDVDGTPNFGLALGHYNPGSTDHGDHAGDLPSLRARTDGGGVLSFEADHLTIEEVIGRTVIVHEGRDNYANIPTRYSATGPDTATLATGDAGGRRYCGEIVAGGG